MNGNDLRNNTKAKTITLGGKEYEIALDFNAICDLEERFGNFNEVAKVLDNISDFSKPDTMKSIRFLLYVMLRHADEKITEHEAGRLMTFNEMQKIYDALGQAMNASIGGDGKNAESPQNQ